MRKNKNLKISCFKKETITWMCKTQSWKQAIKIEKRLQKHQNNRLNKNLSREQKLLVTQIKCTRWQIVLHQKQLMNSWIPTHDFRCYSNKNSVWPQNRIEQVSVKQVKENFSIWHIWQTFCHIHRRIGWSNCSETIIMKNYTNKLSWWVCLSSSGTIGSKSN